MKRLVNWVKGYVGMSLEKEKKNQLDERQKKKKKKIKKIRYKQ